MRYIITLSVALASLCTFAQEAWMQKGASNRRLKSGTHGTTTMSEPSLKKIIGTKIPKATARKSRYGRKWVINLDKFKISNKGVNPEATSNGINQALKYAQQLKYNRIVFPKGIYLISEKTPIRISNTDAIIDLNGATIQMNTNSLGSYQAVIIDRGAAKLRLTNGTIKGDRDQHDYSTPGTHEHCVGLAFHSGDNLEIDNIKVTEFPGYGVASRNDVGRGTSYDWISADKLEQGTFSKTGKKTPSSTRLRTIKTINISKIKRGQFEFGYTFGYEGYPSIKSRQYQVYFYDNAMRFLKRLECLQFRKIRIPSRAQFLHLEFNQPSAENGSEGAIGRITDFAPSTNVHFHHNHLHRNRALGFAFCGGQRWVIENNLIEANGGQAPGYGVDFEDGWDLMYDIVFRKNTFKGNLAGDLVVCAGTEMVFERNTFHNRVYFYDRVHNYAVRNNKINGASFGFNFGISRGFISNNTIEGGTQKLVWNPGARPNVDEVVIENEVFNNVQALSGNHLRYANCKLNNVKIYVSKDTKTLYLRNCHLNNVSVEYQAGGPVDVTIKGCRGEPKEIGPGLTRKRVK